MAIAPVKDFLIDALEAFEAWDIWLFGPLLLPTDDLNFETFFSVSYDIK